MVLLVGQSSWHANKAQIEMLQELRKAINVMEDELRETAQHKITVGPIVADGTPHTSITFRKAIGIDGGSTQWDEDNDAPPNPRFTKFILGGTDFDQLLENVEVDDGDVNTNTSRVIAQDISKLEFSRTLATANIIDVTLAALKETTDGRILTLEFSFSVQMRN